jgi:HEPN domain-containing protein
MSDPNNPLDWAAYAEEDFKVAKIALRKSKPLIGISCYHSQQCAEKYLKGMLIYKNIKFPETEDLPALDTLCNNAEITTGFSQDGLDTLTAYTSLSCGIPEFSITVKDAQEAIEIATTIRKFSRAFLGLKK